MFDYNKVIIVGTVLELDRSTTGNGHSQCRFTVAVRHRFKSGGEIKEDHVPIQGKAFGGIADAMLSSVKAGDRVLVEGRLVVDRWTGLTGEHLTRMKILCEHFRMDLTPIRTEGAA